MVLFYFRHTGCRPKSSVNFFPCVRSSASTSAGLPGICQKLFLGKCSYAVETLCTCQSKHPYTIMSSSTREKLHKMWGRNWIYFFPPKATALFLLPLTSICELQCVACQTNLKRCAKSKTVKEISPLMPISSEEAKTRQCRLWSLLQYSNDKEN